MGDGDPVVKRLEGEISYLKDAVIPALRDEAARLRATIKTTQCPRPANSVPTDVTDWTVEQCVGRLECGCDLGAAIGHQQFNDGAQAMTMPAIESVEGLRKAAEAAPMVVEPVSAADMAARLTWAEIERLRAALILVRLYIADQPIANAVVVPAGDSPRGDHPSLLAIIDAALSHQQKEDVPK